MKPLLVFLLAVLCTGCELEASYFHYDLSPLQRLPDYSIAEGTAISFHIAFCRELSYAGHCPNGTSACARIQGSNRAFSVGDSSSLTIVERDPIGSGVVIKYAMGQECKDGKNYEAHIALYCARGIEDPLISYMSGFTSHEGGSECVFTFEGGTRYACPTGLGPPKRLFNMSYWAMAATFLTSVFLIVSLYFCLPWAFQRVCKNAASGVLNKVSGKNRAYAPLYKDTEMNGV